MHDGFKFNLYLSVFFNKSISFKTKRKEHCYNDKLSKLIAIINKKINNIKLIPIKFLKNLIVSGIKYEFF